MGLQAGDSVQGCEVQAATRCMVAGYRHGAVGCRLATRCKAAGWRWAAEVRACQGLQKSVHGGGCWGGRVQGLREDAFIV